MKSSALTRRQFAQSTGALGAVLALSKPPSVLPAESPGNRVVVGVVGLSRGMAHVAGHLGVNNVEVAYVCDVDSARLASGLKTAENKQPNAVRKPQGVDDFRRILDDKNIDAVSIAAPNFWHTPMAILAMQAGKHVYVEKPGSHNPWEAEAIVAAAAKYKRKCQMGNQRRSYANVIEGIQKLREGVIGKVLFSRCYYNGARPSIKNGQPGQPPATLNWTL
ncbi:MAG: gfo/Idh/MocA family oxidoreductase, partial [Verrucomicrobia bacterium]|nr:gfo/Idh/MocA family oxidoreductase [Verrucomicrobiota bacterium]